MTAEQDHVCVGPDGGQLLGYLCSLGLLEAAHRSLPEHESRLGFTWHRVGWRPRLRIAPALGFDRVADAVAKWIALQSAAPELCLGDDLPCDPVAFEKVALEALTLPDRAVVDRLAAFGWKRSADAFEDTEFRTMRGAGHQHFLAFARTLASETSRTDLDRCLLAVWDYADPGPSLRFDPIDDRRYALRADDPAASSSAHPIRTMRAANALAVEGLRVLPVVPSRRGGRTTLFDGAGGAPTVRWPVWERPVTRDAVASLLAAGARSAAGVAAVYESRRLTIGKMRVFTPARQVA